MHLAVPVAPLLLLPFILVFFIVIFPLWGVSLGILGLLLLAARAVDWVLRALRIGAAGGTITVLRSALRWVLTFGGFTERGRSGK